MSHACSRDRKGRSLLPLLLTTLALACHGKEEVADAGPPAVSAAPVDRLAPGELLPGTAKAFAIVLPRDMRVDQSLTDVVFASGPVNAADLANYVRARVRDGDVSVGANATVFDKVRAVDVPNRLLFVRIFPGPMGRGAHLEIRDVTPAPLQDLPNEESRWKQVGLSPDGRLLDPQHLK
jgi:hypothetical protein